MKQYALFILNYSLVNVRHYFVSGNSLSQFYFRESSRDILYKYTRTNRPNTFLLESVNPADSVRISINSKTIF